MANWVQVPNGPLVNFDFVHSINLVVNTIVIGTSYGDQSINYRSGAEAAAAMHILSNAVASTIPGSATLVSIDPATVADGGDETFTVTGTNFLPSASFTIGSLTLTGEALQVLSGTTILILWTGFAPGAGVYDVIYSDAAGGSGTLPAALTVT